MPQHAPEAVAVSRLELLSILRGHRTNLECNDV